MNMNFAPPQDDETFPRTLYVGNLDLNVSESLITELFGVIGPVKSCKMIQDAHGCDPYCFVEFNDHAHALRAHGAMNQRKILGKEIRVNWATRPAGKRDTSNTAGHHHIFCGDLAPETTSEDLKMYFGKIAEVSDARVMRDLTTNKSKGYGFVSFVHYQDAQDIVEKKKMVPEALHGRQVRCNWAARKGGQTGSNFAKLDYQTVVSQSSQTNCTVYLGGCMSGLTDQLMRETFAGFGNILEIRVFPDKGYAFIRFDNHNDAAQAITSKHGSSLEGYTIKCSWGKEGAAMGGPVTNMGAGYTNGVSSNPTTNGMSQPSMDNMSGMPAMNQWSPGNNDMWGCQNQQQYSQWTQWRGQNQPQQQQNPWNTWTPNQMGGSNNPWGAPSATNTWGGNSTNQNMNQQQQQQGQGGNPWSNWPTMGQQPAGGDAWGNSNTQGNTQNDQMWSNSSWNSPVNPQQQQAQQQHQNGANPMLSGSGDPGSQQQQQQNNSQSTNGFGL